MAVDFGVVEGIPHTGVYTSDQGAVEVAGLELARIERAWLRFNNSIDVYRETGRRWGTTYAGIPRVTGQILRAYVNAGEAKMLLGRKPDVDNPVGPGVITSENLKTFMQQQTSKYPMNAADYSVGFYPIRANIMIEVNKDGLPSTFATSPDDPTVGTGYLQRFIAKKVLLNTYALVFNANGLITSGPIDFMGSALEWRRDPPE